jgi:hypothetical protein
MKKIILYLNLIIACLILTASCNNGDNMPAQTNNLPSIKDVPQASWDKLVQKKIYFGHQSVGYNIIDGIKDVMKENPQIKLNIVETSNPSDFNTGVFAHSKVGKNLEPKTKIDEFKKFMDEGLGSKTDLGFLKLCYVDIMQNTNVGDLFNEYHAKTSLLKQKYPQLTIIHFTNPLTTIQSGPKAWVKKIIGREVSGYEENIKRNKFNELLINKYQGKEPVFDLSKLESTLPDGTRASFDKEGKTFYYLAEKYTNDGGHLNELGRKTVAEQFLIFLTKL